MTTPTLPERLRSMADRENSRLSERDRVLVLLAADALERFEIQAEKIHEAHKADLRELIYVQADRSVMLQRLRDLIHVVVNE